MTPGVSPSVSVARGALCCAARSGYGWRNPDNSTLGAVRRPNACSPKPSSDSVFSTLEFRRPSSVDLSGLGRGNLGVGGLGRVPAGSRANAGTPRCALTASSGSGRYSGAAPSLVPREELRGHHQGPHHRRRVRTPPLIAREPRYARRTTESETPVQTRRLIAAPNEELFRYARRTRGSAS